MLREISSDLDLFVNAAQAAHSPDKQYKYEEDIPNDQTEASNYTYYTNETVVATQSRSYEPYINSLQTILKRQGPIAGALGNVVSSMSEFFDFSIIMFGVHVSPLKQYPCPSVANSRI